jgi:hypothetical protein
MEPGEERAMVYGTERIAMFEGLRGRRITGWQGTDRLTGLGGSPEPESQDPNLPCLNLSNLFASIDADDSVHIFVGEMRGDDWTFALSIDNDVHPAGREISGASRGREPLTLPTGIVENVDVRLEDGVIAEVALGIGGVEMLLIPGDLDEDWDNPQVWRRFDEHVLAFADASDADRIDWAPPRNP